MKRKNTILLPINGDDPDRNVRVTCTQQDKGYYLGDLYILGTNFHVEAIQLDKVRYVTAWNELYQNRLDRYIESNENLHPEIVTLGRRTFFINIEAYAL